jgi:hypothetical protein
VLKGGTGVRTYTQARLSHREVQWGLPERERPNYGDSAGQKRGRRIIKGWQEGEYDGVVRTDGSGGEGSRHYYYHQTLLVPSSSSMG